MKKEKDYQNGMIKQDVLIVKSNNLNEKAYKLTVNEQKLILLLVSNLKKDEEKFNLVRFNIPEVLNFLGMEEGSKNYSYLRGVTKKLLQRYIEFPYIDEKTNKLKFLQTNWLASALYGVDEGIVELKFSEELMPFLLKLQEKFLKYNIKNIVHLESFYSIRIYELLKQYLNIGERIFNIEDLKYILGIEENNKTYKLYGCFKQKIILPSQKELKEKTDIYFEFEEIKTSRKVTSIKFNIYENKINEPKVLEQKEPETKQLTLFDIPVNQKILEVLTYYGLTEKQAIQFAQTKTEKEIEIILDVYMKYCETHDVKNKIGLLYRLLENGANSKSPYEIEQEDKLNQEQERAERQKIEMEKEKNLYKKLFEEYEKEKSILIEKIIQEQTKDILFNELKEVSKNDSITMNLLKRGLDTITAKMALNRYIIKYKLEKCYSSFQQWSQEKRNTDIPERYLKEF